MKKALALILCMVLVLPTVFVTAYAQEQEALFTDYVRGEKPANAFQGTTTANNFTERWNAIYNVYAPNHSNGIEGAMRYTLLSSPAYPNASRYGIAGGTYTSSKVFPDFTFEDDTNYVIEAQYKNNSDVPANFGFSIDSYALSVDVARPYVYDTITAFGDDWFDFRKVINSGTLGPDGPNLRYGYPVKDGEKTPAGSDVLYKLGTMYFAKEEAYDISVVSSDTVMLEGVDTLTFTASVINQIGIPYEGDVDLEWYVTDKARTQKITGFTITEKDDMTVTVEVPKGGAEPGDYVVIAEDSNLADGFRKGTEITVKPYYSKDNGDISIRAKLNTEDGVWTTGSVATGLVDTILVEATLLGKTDDFIWYAVNADRNAKVDSFSFEVSKDTDKETATVTPASDVTEGDYYIVAESSDGMLCAQPVTIDKSGDILVIRNAIISKDAVKVKEGWETNYPDILELSDSVAIKADTDALVEILISSAEDEKLSEVTELSEFREIIERLSVVSMYNKTPEEVELYDENGDFVYGDILKVDQIDKDEVTIFSAFNTLLTSTNKSKVHSALCGNGYKTWTDMYSDIKEQMILHALAYPNVYGVEYAEEVLTKANLEAVGIDPDNYIGLSDKSDFNDSVTKELLTIDELKEMVESAQDYEEDTEEDYEEQKRPSYTGGGDFRVGSTEEEKPEENTPTVPAQTELFADVPLNHWACEDIHYLKSLGVISGITEETFAPEAMVTREQFVKLVVDAFKVGSASADAGFSDVDAFAWYAPYITRAVGEGIISGKGNGNFGVGENITRQDVCIIIARVLGLENDPEGQLIFTDSDLISDYARSAVSSLSGYAILNGFPDGSFGPLEQCTRAQAARIISNALGISNVIGTNGR